MRKKEFWDDTQHFKNTIDTILYNKTFTQVDWIIMCDGLQQDLAIKNIYRPTAELALLLVKIKLNEFPNVPDNNKIRLIQLNNHQLYQVLDIIKYSPHFENIKHKIIKILSRSKEPAHQLAVLLT